METDKRIRVVPVAPWHVMTVHNHHVRVSFRQQLVSERHAQRAATDDEVVR